MRLAPRLVALLLCATALTGCSTVGLLAAAGSDDDRKPPPPPAAVTPARAASDVEGNVRHAQLLRIAGKYDDAIKILAQLLLVAPDDPRVTAEYGKSLAQKGRASDANQVLRRAIEQAPSDWTLYSVLGVTYDQIGDPVNARAAYEHALALKPGEPSVLSNYAMSRLLAKDPDNARLLIAQAQAAAGSTAHPEIAHNVELIAAMAPEKPAEAEKPTAVASAVKSALDKPAPTPAPKVAANKPAPAKSEEPSRPKAPVIAAAAPPPAPQPQSDGTPRTAGDVAMLLASQPVESGAAQGAPRALSAPQPGGVQSGPPIPVAENTAIAPPALEAQPIAQAPQPIVPSGVVMQAVPYDPYAGPVVKLKKPAPKVVARKDAPKAEAKPAPVKTASTKSASKVPALRMAADKY